MKSIRSILVGVFLISCVTVFAQEIKRIKITDLEKTIAESKTPLIINFWATWCKPCIEEIPYFQAEVAQHKSDSLQLLLVSLDMKEMYPKGLSSFVKKRKISATVVFLDETNADYFCPKVDAKWSGAIPASLFLNNKTGYRKFVEDQLTEEELKKEIMAILSKN
ncbi:MAG: TlpA family protein disulfide reductase [Chitinophagales bacterium]|nr:TlpA family protein disulfide reductase [Chitinophagales bacterium]